MPAKKKTEEPIVNETAAADLMEPGVEDVNGENADMNSSAGDENPPTGPIEPDVDAPPEETEPEDADTPPEEPPGDTGEDEPPVLAKKTASRKTSRKETPEPPPEPSGGDAEPPAEADAPGVPPEDLPEEPPEEPPAKKPPDVKPPPKAPKKTAPRKKTIRDLDLNELDRNLSPEQQQEWSSIYASYRSKSILRGAVVGVDETTFELRNRETGEIERKTMTSLIVIDYRVKVLIPETEMWMPGEERPNHVLRSMVGCQIDYVVMEIDREGDCAIASRRTALSAKRHFFTTSRVAHSDGDRLKCSILSVGAKRCLVECNGFDVRLSQRDMSYTAIADLREKYRPGQELDCLFKSYSKETNRLIISVKETYPNPFTGADARHPVGSRRKAVISGKYGGGVFCTLPDDTTCLCLYSTRHDDGNFGIGDSVIIVIRQYDYSRQLIYGRILSKW